MVLLLVFSFPLTFSGLLQVARAPRCQWVCGNILWREKCNHIGPVAEYAGGVNPGLRPERTAFYNPSRRHSSLAFLPPAAFEYQFHNNQCFREYIQK